MCVYIYMDVLINIICNVNRISVLYDILINIFIRKLIIELNIFMIIILGKYSTMI